ncbi:Peroxidase [Lunatimonas lonarensis]|uniref:Peroxidase n=1 Tax=Lunatimonas lonarensis TaxID=1232681 RepID=R7ZRD5_9BACT|nr:Peroxidase [Lunatimonas lonarensis]
MAIRGHGHLLSARYLLLQFTDSANGKAYLAELEPLITTATERKPDVARQLAFTYSGLQFLQLPERTLGSFSREFREGMTEAHRQFILGDFGEHSPDNWDWGNNPSEIHLLLMLFAEGEEDLQQLVDQELTRASAYGVKHQVSLPTAMLHDQKEHFGFRDDISRPIISELVKDKELGTTPTFPAGEFIMGYKNLYDEYAPSPLVEETQQGAEVLSGHPDLPGLVDLGRNGTYLVFRQLKQEVFLFWEYLKSQSSSMEDSIALASKMVGRWPDGSPLVLCPFKNDPSLAQANNFGYWDEDRDGMKCPIGAHIRRTNPRDHLVTETSKKDSTEMVAKHLMLRKGRPYGNPVSKGMVLNEILAAEDDGEDRGLHFICMVTDIRRQFEFVQNNWVNFHKFGGSEEDADPLIGNHYQEGSVVTDRFSIPRYPVRRRLENLPNFVQVRGGGYFFFPGKKALQFISKYHED